MEEVAALAGVTRLIVYRHFDSKEALYRAVLDRAVQGLSTAVTEHLAGGTTSRAVVTAFLDAARRDPDGFRVLVRQAPREADFAEYSDRFRVRAIRGGQDLISAAVPDPMLRSWAAATLVGLLEEATLSWIDRGNPQRDEEMISMLTSSIQSMLRVLPRSED
jgi:AcrR family transcriptional regulator